jgi:hypothetical protein
MLLVFAMTSRILPLLVRQQSHHRRDHIKELIEQIGGFEYLLVVRTCNI